MFGKTYCPKSLPPPPSIPFKWECIDCETRRAKVLGGWIVEVCHYLNQVNMIWVPDPEHGWRIE